MSKKHKLHALRQKEASEEMDVAAGNQDLRNNDPPILCVTIDELNQFSDTFQEILNLSDAEEPECRETIRAIYSLLSMRKYLNQN